MCLLELIPLWMLEEAFIFLCDPSFLRGELGRMKRCQNETVSGTFFESNLLSIL